MKKIIALLCLMGLLVEVCMAIPEPEPEPEPGFIGRRGILGAPYGVIRPGGYLGPYGPGPFLPGRPFGHGRLGGLPLKPYGRYNVW